MTPTPLSTHLTRVLLLLLPLTLSTPAHAFSHVVRPGETLAEIARRVYGDPAKESLLAGANALDVGGGSAIVPGMRIEIPAPLHHRVTVGETWTSLALGWLGSGSRVDILARANKAVPWIQPEPNLEIEIPAVVAHFVSEGDTSTSLAARYWGNGNRGWELNSFNGRSEAPMHRGEIILVPLPGLSLTQAGMSEALAALNLAQSEVSVAGLAAQRHADAELPALVEDLRAGRYVEVVARANRVLGSAELTRQRLTALYLALLEAYVALDAPKEASAICAALRANDKEVRLDPTTTSPKIRAACPK
jgi:LysM domain